MKKAIEFGIILFIFLLVYQYVIVLLENNHVVYYNVKTEDHTFSIKEEYIKSSSDDGYYVTVTSENDDNYEFYINNEYNKKKKIVNNINYEEIDGYLCVYPVTSKKDKNIEIECSKDKITYSVSSLYNKINIKSFIKEFESTNKYESDNKTLITVGTTNYYKNNIFSNEYLALYKYKNLLIYNSDNYKYINLYDNDVYDNSLAGFVDGYYICPNYSSNDFTNGTIIVNLKKQLKRIDTSDYNISLKKSYVLGVVDNKLYIMDLENKAEYSIDTKNKVELVGSVSEGFEYFENGKWSSTTIADFQSSKVKFKNEVNIDIDYDEVYSASNFYYVIKNNKVYKVYKNNTSLLIYLFDIGAHSYVTTNGDNLYYISSDTIYKYDKYGYKKVVKDSELNYHVGVNTFYAYVE